MEHIVRICTLNVFQVNPTESNFSIFQIWSRPTLIIMAIVVELSNRLVESIFLGFVVCFALGIIEEKSVIGYSLYIIYVFVSETSQTS